MQLQLKINNHEINIFSARPTILSVDQREIYKSK
jgi:hypothetical protein